MKTDKHRLKEYKEKLNELSSKDEQLNLIWTWIAARVISRNMFKELLTVIK